jgi:hypothetical protein
MNILYVDFFDSSLSLLLPFSPADTVQQTIQLDCDPFAQYINERLVVNALIKSPTEVKDSDIELITFPVHIIGDWLESSKKGQLNALQYAIATNHGQIQVYHVQSFDENGYYLVVPDEIKDLSLAQSIPVYQIALYVSEEDNHPRWTKVRIDCK